MKFITTFRRLIWAISGMLVFGVPPATAHASVVVQVVNIKPATQSPMYQAIGEVRSLGSVTLTAPATGRIQGPFPPAGEVHQGERITQIIPAGLRAQTAAARAQAANAEQNLQRNERLYRDGVIAKETLDNSRVLLTQAQSSLQGLQEESKQMILRAPFSGTISYQVAPGSVVNAGTIIARLEGRGIPWIHALLPPAVAEQISPKSTVAIHGEDWQGQGIVQSVGSSARQSGLVAVIIQLPHDSRLLPGEWVSLQLPLTTHKTPDTYQVPQAAVLMQGSQAILWSIHNGKAKKVPIQLLYRAQGVAIFRGPVHGGEAVISQGNTRLRNGTDVVARP